MASCKILCKALPIMDHSCGNLCLWEKETTETQAKMNIGKQEWNHHLVQTLGEVYRCLACNSVRPEHCCSNKDQEKKTPLPPSGFLLRSVNKQDTTKGPDFYGRFLILNKNTQTCRIQSSSNCLTQAE